MSPAFPSAALPQLDVAHVLELQPLVLAHLRFDVLPADPLIQLEKALKKTMGRKAGLCYPAS